MVRLQVYIAEDCWACQETTRLIAEMRHLFPDVCFEVLDTAQTPLPDGVFAVPTYVLNGRIISLGNPTRAMLIQKLAAAQP